MKSLNLLNIKAAGVYTLEMDQTARDYPSANPVMRMAIGFSQKGPYNRPVLLRDESDSTEIFGDADKKLERRGCFFNRALNTMLADGPVYGLSLLNVDSTYSGPDQVNYAIISMDSSEPNPAVKNTNLSFCKHDYCMSENMRIYGYDYSRIPYVGAAPYSSMYDRTGFWTPSSESLIQQAARGLNTTDYTQGSAIYPNTSLMQFANVGTQAMSILVWKAEDIHGYDMTAEEYYGTADDIPFSWIHPDDWMSEYFIKVVCVKGDWTNYSKLQNDNVWGPYFDSNGVIKSKINEFAIALGEQYIGQWTGCVIPDFKTPAGVDLFIQRLVNADTEKTGLLMAINTDALYQLTYDYTGKESDEQELAEGCWGLDIGGDGELDADDTDAPYLVDMVGHNMATPGKRKSTYYFNTINHPNNEETLVSIEGVGDNITPYIKPYSLSFDDGVVTEIITTDEVDSYLLTVYDENNPKTFVDKGKTYVEGYYFPKYLFTNADLNGQALDEIHVKQTIVKYCYHITDGNVTCIDNTSGLSIYVDKWNVGAADESTITPDAWNNVRVAIEVGGKKCYTYVAIQVDEANKILAWNPGMHVDREFTSITTVDEIDNILYTQTIEKQQSNGVYDVHVTIENNSDNNIEGTLKYLAVPFGYTENLTASIRFMSYAYDGKISAADSDSMHSALKGVRWFSSADQWPDSAPVTADVLNMVTLTDAEYWTDDYAKIGDYLHNIVYENNNGDAAKYRLIPGVTRITNKQFINVWTKNGDAYITYKNKDYLYTGQYSEKYGKTGFYLLTAISPVYVSEGITYRQRSLADDTVSPTLRFIPLDGLQLSTRHMPGFDGNGKIGREAGIAKIYSVLEDEGLRKALLNDNGIDFRYIVDTMSGGIESSLGGKVYLSQLACDKGHCLAVLNMPSALELHRSTDPYFCDTFSVGQETVPGLNLKYLSTGGNTEMCTGVQLTMPSQDEGSAYAAAFFPNLVYSDNGRKQSVPPAADVCNALYTKHYGSQDKYAVVANMNGLIDNPNVVGVEYDIDETDREYLEKAGINSIIVQSSKPMIYCNRTCYQSRLSDLNYLSVRENLNTIEIECYETLKPYNFLYNTKQIRTQITNSLNTMLSAIKVSGALEEYKVICDTTNNTDEVIANDYCVVDIQLKFRHCMEKIVQRLQLRRSVSTKGSTKKVVSNSK